MKRLNIETNQPYTRGFVRNDGMVFCSYSVCKKGKDGFFHEWWQTKEKFDKQTKKMTNYSATKANTIEGRAKKLVSAAKVRAKKNNSKLEITYEWVAEKIQNGVCELTGLPFDLNSPQNTKNNPYSPSLDRIDSKNKDYTPENTRVVLSAVNMALNEFGLDVMKPIMEKLLK